MATKFAISVFFVIDVTFEVYTVEGSRIDKSRELKRMQMHVRILSPSATATTIPCRTKIDFWWGGTGFEKPVNWCSKCA